MIEFKKGNIFTTECDVIVNTVNCVGAMGAGIAYEFKLRFPEMFKKYKKLCDEKKLDIGLLWIYTIPYSNNHFSRILNFPTKRNWRFPTEKIFLEQGLQKFIDTYEEKNIQSIAFPYLGAGHGGLSSKISLEIMQKYLENLPIKIEIWEYDPNAEDDLYQNFRQIFLNLNIQEIGQFSGLKKDKIEIIQENLQNNNIKNINGLTNIKGIGSLTLEKLLIFIQTYQKK